MAEKKYPESGGVRILTWARDAFVEEVRGLKASAHGVTIGAAMTAGLFWWMGLSREDKLRAVRAVQDHGSGDAEAMVTLMAEIAAAAVAPAEGDIAADCEELRDRLRGGLARTARQR